VENSGVVQQASLLHINRRRKVVENTGLSSLFTVKHRTGMAELRAGRIIAGVPSEVRFG